MEVVKYFRKVELLSKLLRIVTSSSRKFIYCKCAEEKLGMPLFAYGELTELSSSGWKTRPCKKLYRSLNEVLNRRMLPMSEYRCLQEKGSQSSA